MGLLDKWRQRGWQEISREDYQRAYEAVLSRCNTEYALWHVIPANRKWYRNLVIIESPDDCRHIHNFHPGFLNVFYGLHF